ncbi:MAG: MarR family transcriptional regulator [Atribacterota bacterium]|nr:MarR family transcriptional regulator [Atribacterota bacterium]
MSASCKLNTAELNGLRVMEESAVLNCSQFSDKVGLSASRGSRIIDSLVKKGYILRITKKEDRRTTLLVLTEKGKKIKNKVFSQQTEFEKKLAAEMSKQEIDSINLGLKLLEKFFNKSNQKGD